MTRDSTTFPKLDYGRGSRPFSAHVRNSSGVFYKNPRASCALNNAGSARPFPSVRICMYSTAGPTYSTRRRTFIFEIPTIPRVIERRISPTPENPSPPLSYRLRLFTSIVVVRRTDQSNYFYRFSFASKYELPVSGIRIKFTRVWCFRGGKSNIVLGEKCRRDVQRMFSE